jgi:hypothetical protein
MNAGIQAVSFTTSIPLIPVEYSRFLSTDGFLLTQPMGCRTKDHSAGKTTAVFNRDEGDEGDFKHGFRVAPFALNPLCGFAPLR